MRPGCLPDTESRLGEKALPGGQMGRSFRPSYSKSASLLEQSNITVSLRRLAKGHGNAPVNIRVYWLSVSVEGVGKNTQCLALR